MFNEKYSGWMEKQTFVGTIMEGILTFQVYFYINKKLGGLSNWCCGEQMSLPHKQEAK